jgi:hypothetical protein
MDRDDSAFMTHKKAPDNAGALNGFKNQRRLVTRDDGVAPVEVIHTPWIINPAL